MDVHPWQVENPGQKAGCVGQQVFTSSPITRHSLNQTQGETRQEMGEIAQKNAQFLILIFWREITKNLTSYFAIIHAELCLNCQI